MKIVIKFNSHFHNCILIILDTFQLNEIVMDGGSLRVISLLKVVCHILIVKHLSPSN